MITGNLLQKMPTQSQEVLTHGQEVLTDSFAFSPHRRLCE